MDNEILKDTIDVIIPCYNAEKYIEFAVNSILNQTNPSYRRLKNRAKELKDLGAKAFDRGIED